MTRLNLGSKALRTILTLVTCSVIVVACSRETFVVLDESAAEVGVREPVLVASTRQFHDGYFGSARQSGLSYVHYDVRIPPNRDVGTVEGVTTLEVDADNRTQFVVSDAVQLENNSEFRRILRQELIARPPWEREVMVFVHGYNTDFAAGLYRTAQIRHDFNVPGVAVHYAWPSAGRALAYAYDRDSALFARDGLEELLTTLANDGHDIVLVAHSMGGAVTMETLRQLSIGNRRNVLRRITGVFLLSPDIDVDVFVAQASRLDPIPPNFLIFTSQQDRALRFSARLSGRRDRLGTLPAADQIADLDVTLIDVSDFESGMGDQFNHLTPASSPATVSILRDVAMVNLSLQDEVDNEILMLPGMLMSIRQATRIMLEPQNTQGR